MNNHSGSKLGANWSQYMRQEGFREYGVEELNSRDGLTPDQYQRYFLLIQESETPEQMWAGLSS